MFFNFNRHKLLSLYAARLPGIIPILLALFCLSGPAHADSTLDEWRKEAAATRTLAENDVPRAHDEALHLQTQLPADALPTDKARVLNLLARTEFYAARTEAAELHAQQALQLATQNADKAGQAEAYLTLSMNAINQGRIDTLVDTTTRALDVLQGVDRPDLLGEAMLHAAIMDWRTGKIEASVTLCMQAMDIAKRSNDPLALLYANYGLAITNMQTGSPAESRVYFTQMRELARGVHMKQLEAETMMGLADLASKFGKLDEAESSIREAISVYREVGAPFNIARGLFALANNQRLQGRQADSLRSLDEVIALYGRYPSKIGLWWTLDARSENLQALGRLADAQTDAKRAYALAKNIGLPLYQSKSMQRLAALSAASGDHQRAYQLSVEAAALTSKLASDKSSHLLSDLAQRYQEDSKQRQIDETQLQHARHLQILTAFGGSIILLVVTAYLLLRLRGSNRQLERSQDQIRALNIGLEQRVQEQTVELDLRERELRTLAGNIPGFIFTLRVGTDGHTSFPYVSAGVEQLFGLRPENVLGDAAVLRARYHPDDLPRILALMEETERTLEPFRIEIRISNRDDEQSWIEIRSMPQRQPDGATEWHGMMLDITERKRIEQEIRLKEFVLDHAQDAVYLIDSNLSFVYINEEACRALGYSRDELMRLSPSDIDPYTTPEDARIIWKNILAEGSVKFETRQRRRDGSELSVEIKGSLFEYEDQVLQMALVRDITERKRMEQTLIASEHEFRSLAENLPDNIARWDFEGRIIYSNSIHQRSLGRSAIELIGKTHREAFPDGRYDPVDAGIAKVIATGQAALYVRQPVSFENGETEIHDVKLVPERDADGKIISVLGVGRNMTDLYRLQDELKASELQLRSLADSSPGMMGTFYARPDGSICMPYVSPNIEKIFGINPQDVAHDASALIALNHPDDARRVAESIAESARNMTLWHEEYRILHPTLGERWMESNTMPTLHPEGGVIWYGYVHDITERKRLEDSLVKREKEFRSLADNLPDNIARWDTEGRYLYINPIHERTLGVALQDVIGKPIPDTHNHVKATIAQVVSTGQAVEFVRQLVVVNGESQIHDVNIVPERDDAGNVVAVLGLGRNMTELYRLQDNLSDAQKLALLGSWNWDVVMNRIECSEMAYEIYRPDMRPANPGFEDFKSSIHPDDLEEVIEAVQSALEHDKPFDLDHRVVSVSKGIRTVHAQGKVFRDANGKPVRMVGTVQDITERKLVEDLLKERFEQIVELNDQLEVNARDLEDRAAEFEAQAVELEASQEHLIQTEAWYRSILQSAPDGMLIVDSSGLIMQANAQLDAMFGYDGGELPGCRIEVLIPQAARAVHVEQRTAFISSSVTDRRMASTAKDLFGCRKNGTVFPVDVSLSRLPDLEGRVGAICAAVRDVTERQKSEQVRESALSEALRLAQLRSAFLAQMSHELRTPLNGILGYTQNLLHGEALAEKQVDGLRIIQRSGEHLLSLINGILDHAAIEAGKFELIPGDIELEPFLGTVIGIIRVRAEQKNIAFTCVADDGLPAVVRGDAQRLRQVLLNLLSNAVKFTDNGQVMLRVNYTAPSRLRFAVQDSGVGIAADQLNSIFLPFEQVGAASRRAGGTGLGLAISRKLVTLMGADIQVESQPGAGSTFSFEIEMEAAQTGEGTVNVAALSGQALTRVTQTIPDLLAPPRQELDILHSLALRGNMRDVIKHVTRLAELDTRYLPFAEHLCRLAKSFQTKALVNLIEQYRSEKADKL